MRWRLLPFAAALLTTVHPLAAQDCRVPVLRRGPEGFSLAFLTVPARESTVLLPGQTERVITPIVPVSAGMSGDVVRGTDNDLLVLRCDGDQVRVLKGAPGGGAAREVMAGARDAYARYTIRVNAVGQDGVTAAFWIREGRAEPADGPVIDMFRGMVPLAAGDVVVTTEIREAETRAAPGLVGRVPLGAVGPYPSVPVTLPGGRTGRFILDLAASRSLIYRELLPADVPIQKMMAVERSADGTRELGGSAQGAGGAASSISAVAELPWLRLGDVRVEGLQPLVLDEPFVVDGAPIDGIIGLDVLRRAGRVRADFGRPTSASFLTLGGDSLTVARTLPLREVRGLLFVEGRLGALPVLFLLDSGARLSVLPDTIATREGWTRSAVVVDSLRGADGRSLPVRTVDAPTLRLHDWTPPATGIVTGPIPVLDNLGLREDAAILGQPFWQAVGLVEIDFAAGVMRVPRR